MSVTPTPVPEVDLVPALFHPEHSPNSALNAARRELTRVVWSGRCNRVELTPSAWQEGDASYLGVRAVFTQHDTRDDGGAGDPCYIYGNRDRCCDHLFPECEVCGVAACPAATCADCEPPDSYHVRTLHPPPPRDSCPTASSPSTRLRLAACVRPSVRGLAARLGGRGRACRLHLVL